MIPSFNDGQRAIKAVERLHGINYFIAKGLEKLPDIIAKHGLTEKELELFDAFIQTFGYNTGGEKLAEAYMELLKEKKDVC